MNYLPLTILAYFLNSIAVTVDKFLLKKFIPDPLVYIFYFSLYSLLALVAIPFTEPPNFNVFLLTSSSTILWTLGAYFMFKALSTGVVSRVIPIIGTLTPLILLIHAASFATISQNQILATGILILGLFLITLPNLKSSASSSISLRRELVLELLASSLFAISYLILRQAYLQENFLTVLVWGRIILLPIGVSILLIPGLRKKVLSSEGLKVNFKSKFGVLFTLGQLAGGLSQLILVFAISLATPALINSLQGTQYIFLLLISFFLSNRFPKVFEEKNTYLSYLNKTLGIIIIFIGLYILSFNIKTDYKLGASFSPVFASSLGLDPKTTFVNLLDQTGVKYIRLPVYWDQIENIPKTVDFAGVDYYLNEASIRGVSVILVLGYKQPRWPECFAPEWVNKLPRKERDARILEIIQKEIDHFKSYPNIYAWQIENEPFFQFGICDEINSKTFEAVKKEVQIVKAKDFRPVLITDSGELSNWVEAAGTGDYFGHTLYRNVWSPVFGFVDYPLPPIFYTLKAQLIRLLTLDLSKKVIISELQAEPWYPKGLSALQVNPDEQAKIFTVKKLSSTVEYAKETGASEIFLWGAEWWYFMAKKGHPEYLEYAKTLF